MLDIAAAQGALQVMKKLPQAVSIFILPPSPQVLERRLRNRSQAEGVHDEAVIAARLKQARQELMHLDNYKYALVNDVLDRAATELRAIVLDARGENGEESALAASCSTAHMNPRLTAALKSFGVTETSVVENPATIRSRWELAQRTGFGVTMNSSSGGRFP